MGNAGIVHWHGIKEVVVFPRHNANVKFTKFFALFCHRDEERPTPSVKLTDFARVPST